MTLSEKDIALLRAALIAARQHYCGYLAEYGDDGIANPQPDIKAAMELVGMKWDGDEFEIVSHGGDFWSGNEQFKPHA